MDGLMVGPFRGRPPSKKGRSTEAKDDPKDIPGDSVYTDDSDES